eukprot:TRINITY_DN7379_c0_g1_i2.p1 TRINITY_DN7379_c0_g1~~TRINITY_DN7379_c0_g1_i2.p1  ORF type:complete len:769 (-),score=206.50 TRINITY_DN7379_c0_g1_i2:79-2385(-)
MQIQVLKNLHNIKIDVLTDFKPFVDSDYYERWERLRRLLDLLYLTGEISPILHRLQKEKVVLEDVFQGVQDICRNGFAKKLATDVSNYYATLIGKLLCSVIQPGQRNFLEELNAVWLLLRQTLPLLTNVLSFFERSFLIRSPARSLEQLIVSEFRSQLDKQETKILEPCVQQLLSAISLWREGLADESQLDTVQSISHMLMKVELYKSRFEPEFIRLSKEYYTNVAAEKAKRPGFDLVTYLADVESTIKAEHSMILERLDASSAPAIVELVTDALVNSNLQLMLFHYEGLLRSRNFNALQRMLRLFERVDKREFLRKSFGNYVKTQGSNLVDREDGVIESLLDLKRTAEDIIRESYDNMKEFLDQIYYAYEHFMGLKPNKVAELATKYLDDILSKQPVRPPTGENSGSVSLQGGISDSDFRHRAEELLALFKYLSAKDIFEAFYTRRMMRRLLLNRSSSNENEKYMLEQFEKICGDTYVKRADEILRSFEKARELTNEFNSWNTKSEMHEEGSGKESAPDCGFYVISASSWSLPIVPVLSWSAPFDIIRERFAIFYKERYKSTRLDWLYEGSTCDVSGIFGGRRYTFVVSMMQAVILLSFNLNLSYTFDDLLAHICPPGIKEDIRSLLISELKKTLISMSVMKTTLLLKENAQTQSVTPKETFKLNEAFTSKSSHLKINSIQKRETREQVEATTEKVLNERKYQFEAAFVRIMKGRKEMRHNELIEAVINEVKLPAPASELKRIIESLIERDYLERDKHDNSKYIYLA